MRALSLDALRGYAILTMVLSANIVFGILPGWMYHAQTPPPTHVFQPELAGITWVDLVFPFFLFSMGAAFPFSLRKKLERGVSRIKISSDIVLRGLQMAFFAIFIQHFYPYMLSDPQDTRAWLLAIACFAVLFPMFMRLPFPAPRWVQIGIKILAYVLAVIMLATARWAHMPHFSLYTSNIIILVLANMAVFGSLIYLFTIENRKMRLLSLAFLGAILLSATEENSWTNWLANATPFAWLYQFKFLKYLFVVLFGSIVGDILSQYVDSQKDDTILDKKIPALLAILALGTIIFNLVALYKRLSLVSLLGSAVLLCMMFLLLHKKTHATHLFWRQLVCIGALLLLIGLCLEPFQGGIKKDGPTFSYLFVTSGLATLALLFFHILCDYFCFERTTRFLVMSGQNPMLAYVSGSLFVWPVLSLLGISPHFAIFATNAWLGFLQGVIITTLVIVVTMFFTRIKWFWRT